MNHHNERMPLRGILIILFAIAVVGLVILVWLAPVAAADMTPAQDRLLNVGDWMLKAAIGAILGFAGANLAARNGNRAAE